VINSIALRNMGAFRFMRGLYSESKTRQSTQSGECSHNCTGSRRPASMLLSAKEARHGPPSDRPHPSGPACPCARDSGDRAPPRRPFSAPLASATGGVMKKRRTCLILAILSRLRCINLSAVG
jgi:hypothetical protein